MAFGACLVAEDVAANDVAAREHVSELPADGGYDTIGGCAGGEIAMK